MTGENHATIIVNLSAAAANAKRAAVERNDAIRRASDGGMSIRTIANAAGLSSARVHQILHGR